VPVLPPGLITKVQLSAVGYRWPSLSISFALTNTDAHGQGQVLKGRWVVGRGAILFITFKRIILVSRLAF